MKNIWCNPHSNKALKVYTVCSLYHHFIGQVHVHRLNLRRWLFFLFFLYSWQVIYIMTNISIYHNLSWYFHNYWKANWRQLSKWYVSLIFTTQINPTCGTYVLQSLQWHSDGIHFFIFLLKISRDSESFMSFGKMSHIFGAKKGTVSVPYLTEFTLRLVRTLFPRKL